MQRDPAANKGGWKNRPGRRKKQSIWISVGSKLQTVILCKQFSSILTFKIMSVDPINFEDYVNNDCNSSS